MLDWRKLLKQMVESIRAVEQVMGSGEKVVQPSEMTNRDTARKSLVATRNIRQGERFSVENLGAKRPGTGINPMEYWTLLGKEAELDIEFDELI